MMNYWGIYGIIMLYSIGLCAQQKQVEITFCPMYLEHNLLTTSNQLQFEERAIVFTRFKCYLTNFELWKNGRLVWKEKDSYHLINLEELSTCKLSLKLPEDLEYDNLKYQLGVDSTTNVSGAMGGDLDPTKGMYWTWNSGYINFKLEGKYEACPTRKHKFQFHLGGYMPPFASVQPITHTVDQKKHLTVKIQVDQFLKSLNLVEQHSIMSPSRESTQLSTLAASIFYLQND